MKKVKFLLSITTILLLTFYGCKKYPEGPSVSLRSRTERVANNWKVGQVLDKGKDVTSRYNKYELTTTESGIAKLTVKYDIFGTAFEYATTGTWVFVSNQEKLSFDFNNDNADGVYQILKLEEQEMWLKEDGGSLELHYVPR